MCLILNKVFNKTSYGSCYYLSRTSTVIKGASGTKSGILSSFNTILSLRAFLSRFTILAEKCLRSVSLALSFFSLSVSLALSFFALSASLALSFFTLSVSLLCRSFLCLSPLLSLSLLCLSPLLCRSFICLSPCSVCLPGSVFLFFVCLP